MRITCKEKLYEDFATFLSVCTYMSIFFSKTNVQDKKAIFFDQKVKKVIFNIHYDL